MDEVQFLLDTKSWHIHVIMNDVYVCWHSHSSASTVVKHAVTTTIRTPLIFVEVLNKSI